MNVEELRHEANKRVLAFVGDRDLVNLWWNSYDRHFGKTPNEEWKIDHDNVMMYLYTIDNYY